MTEEEILEKAEKIKKERSIGYKGFDKDLKCRHLQYKIGQTYTKPYKKEELKVCSDKAYHFYKDITKLFQSYSNNGSNRFCLVQVGDYVEGSDGKCGTNSIKIIRELTLEEIYRLQFENNELLRKVRKLQSHYVGAHIGGSLALKLYGVDLKREVNNSDIDLVLPYYQVTPELDDDASELQPSGNDFDYCFIYEGIKVDIKIDPKQRYKKIQLGDHIYNVSYPEHILEAKLRYSMCGNSDGAIKHRNDIYKMLNID